MKKILNRPADYVDSNPCLGGIDSEIGSFGASPASQPTRPLALDGLNGTVGRRNTAPLCRP